jgi:hypothetical protein
MSSDTPAGSICLHRGDVSTEQARWKTLRSHPGMGRKYANVWKKVGGFCCPVPPKPLESVLLPGRSNRALAL